jgi:hypothetical protein
MIMRKLNPRALTLTFPLTPAGPAAPRPSLTATSSAPTQATVNERLAADSVRQLVTLYPPASTRFDLASHAGRLRQRAARIAAQQGLRHSRVR